MPAGAADEELRRCLCLCHRLRRQADHRGVRERYEAHRRILRGDIELEIHAHENLSVSVVNSVVAVECGGTRVDASLAGMGAEAGNCHIEAFIAMADLHGWTHSCDLFKQQDAAEKLVRPLQDRPVQVDRETLMLRYAGVYSSFPRHAEEATELHGLDPRDILVELDRRKMVDTRRT